jgi:hypothetical protein
MAGRLNPVIGTAILAVMTFSMSLSAQGRGGPGGAVGFGMRSAPAQAPPVAGRGPGPGPSPAFRGMPPAGSGAATAFHGSVGVAPPLFYGRPGAVYGRHAPGIYPPRTVFVPPPYYGYFSPYMWSAPVYSSPVYIGPDYVSSPIVQSASTSNEAALSYELQRLSREIEQLRAEQSVRALVPAQPAPVPMLEARAIPTVLIFRDGRRVEIQNYVIVGQTVWIVDENTSTKISVEELDLEATQKENQSRGVRFPLPAKRN